MTSNPDPQVEPPSLISEAERAVLDEAKARLVLPSNARPSLEERSLLMRKALEQKKTALLLLASAQKELETHSSFMIEERDLQETIHFHDAHFTIEDPHTAAGRFFNAAASITLARPTRSEANSQAPTHASEPEDPTS